MMSVDSEEIKTIAQLARLALSDQETAAYAGDLSAILALVEQMQSAVGAAVAAQPGGVEPLAHPLEMNQRLRDDLSAPSLHPDLSPEQARERLLSGAPATADGLFLVPKVIE